MIVMYGKVKKHKDGTISKISFTESFDDALDDVTP